MKYPTCICSYVIPSFISEILGRPMSKLDELILGQLNEHSDYIKRNMPARSLNRLHYYNCVVALGRVK